MVSTTTFAQGVNLTAETVVLPEVNRRTGRNTVRWYTAAEYKNIVGRAGRLGLADRDRAIRKHRLGPGRSDDNLATLVL